MGRSSMVVRRLSRYPRGFNLSTSQCNPRTLMRYLEQLSANMRNSIKAARGGVIINPSPITSKYSKKMLLTLKIDPSWWRLR